MKPTAVIGAGGFVGHRLVENMILGGKRELRAIVRSPKNLASLCRFGNDLEIRFADATVPRELTKALDGCGSAVNLVSGTPETIKASSRCLYSACRELGLDRLVHLSSAVVFGDQHTGSVGDPPPQRPRLWMPYAKAKLASERFFKEVMSETKLEISILRPGIVWGPGSFHTAEILEALRTKSAVLVGEGVGLVNGIFVDNLVRSIASCLDHEGNASGFFNVVDDASVTWHQFLDYFAAALDFDMSRIALVSDEKIPRSLAQVLDMVQAIPLTALLYFWLKDRLPWSVKASIKERLENRAAPSCYDVIATEYPKVTSVSREFWSLQKVTYRLDDRVFRKRFRAFERVSLANGVERTLAWAALCGFPVQP